MSFDYFYFTLHCGICGYEDSSTSESYLIEYHNRIHNEYYNKIVQKVKYCQICEEAVGESHFCLSHHATKDFIDVMLELK